MQKIAKPQAGMFKPFSATYINLVDDNISVSAIQTEWEAMKTFFLSIPEDKWNYSYAEDKWTLKEVLVHMIDAERIFAYRALRIARNDTTPLAGFEQNDYVPYSNANNRAPEDIVNEFEAVRRASFYLFNNFEEAAWDRHTLVDNHPVSVRTLLYLVIGHAKHHIGIIREKYLAA